MNIFILDADYAKSAEYHCDKHVVKMVLESAQLLSTAVNLTLQSKIDGIYKSTHINHPCSKWARESRQNFYWLIKFSQSLAKEYTFRYNKIHKSESIINRMLIYLDYFPDKGNVSDFIYCGPSEYKNISVIDSYREFYKKDKRAFCKWTKRDVPYWFN